MPPAAAGKKPAAAASTPPAKDGNNFRARRLSVSDIDTSEFEKAAKGTPSDGTKKGRRLSMSPEMGAAVKKDLLPFPLDVVGTFSCHGVEPGVRAGETSAKINQDRGCIVYPFKPTDNGTYCKSQALFCVYDGHGANGDKVSHFVMTKLQEYLEQSSSLEADVPKAMKEAFLKTDDALKKDKTIDAELSGTTAVVILVRLMADGCLQHWTAWTGDSRAVIAHKNGGAYAHKDLSDDQKPDTPAEQARITRAGGFVSPPEEEWGGPARVWLDAEMTLPGLAMARSIGDHLVKEIGVTADPEVRFEEIPVAVQKDQDPFIVLCSDGVWEFIESDQAVQLLAKFLPDATTACTKLIETAAAKWRQEEGDYRDDITAILLRVSAVSALMGEAGSSDGA